MAHEAGATCADLSRKHGMSEGTFYAWKAKYSGMTVSGVKRLVALKVENAKLKKLLAEQRSASELSPSEGQGRQRPEANPQSDDLI